MKNIVIILAGGKGARLNTNLAKQHVVVQGHEVLEYTLMAFSRMRRVDEIIVVTNPDYRNRVQIMQKSFPKLINVVDGGATRMLSFMNGLLSLKTNDDDNIIVSDAARPCITEKEIDQLIELLNENDAVTTGLECYETLLKMDGTTIVEIIDRKSIIRQTSPEGYKSSVIKNLYFGEPYDVIQTYVNIGIDQLIKKGAKVAVALSNPLNFKITTKDDLLLFESIIKTGFFRK